MAGVAAHEGSLLLHNVVQHIPQNITESEFRKLAQSFDSLFHDLNATAITDFYLGNINKTDPKQVKWALYDLYGDLIMTCPTYQFTKNYATHSDAGSVYFYEITYTRSNKQDPQYDVSHGADLDFVFGLPQIYPDKKDTDVDRKFSLEVMKMWTDFAKFG